MKTARQFANEIDQARGVDILGIVEARDNEWRAFVDDQKAQTANWAYRAGRARVEGYAAGVEFAANEIGRQVLVEFGYGAVADKILAAMRGELEAKGLPK